MGRLFDDLPVLGVGASLSLEAKPDPAELARRAGGPSFVEYAGRLDVDEVLSEVARIRAAGVPVLFHPSYINFCGSAPNDAAWLAETARHVAAVDSPWFAQDCAYCFLGEGQGYSAELGYFVPPVLSRASLERAVERVREVQAAVPRVVAIEPPPMGFSVGRMGLFEWFGELSARTDCALLFDMGHLVSYERASGRKLGDQLEAVALERVIEVHVAGGRLEGEVYVDAHERDILPEVFAMFEALLPRLSNLRAVCFECEGKDEAAVLATLAQLRQSVRRSSTSSALVARAEAS